MARAHRHDLPGQIWHLTYCPELRILFTAVARSRSEIVGVRSYVPISFQLIVIEYRDACGKFDYNPQRISYQMSQRTRVQDTEVRSRRSEVRGRKLEDGSHKSEVGNRKSESKETHLP